MNKGGEGLKGGWRLNEDGYEFEWVKRRINENEEGWIMINKDEEGWWGMQLRMLKKE